jgi:hypothetical protein
LAECFCDFFGCEGCSAIAGSINNQCLIQRSNPGSFMLVRVGKVFDKGLLMILCFAFGTELSGEVIWELSFFLESSLEATARK